MKNRLFAGVALLTLCISTVDAELRVDAGYSAAADLFSLMDNVSDWSPGFTEQEYRDYWQSEFGWSAEDEDWARRYREYRQKTYRDDGQAEQDPRTATDGLFAKRSSVLDTADPLAEHFLSATTIDGALRGLGSIADAKDAAMLEGFYAHFEPHWRVLLAESKSFAERADTLREELSGPAVDAYLDRVARFYRVDIDRDFRALYVWWPPLDRTAADISGRGFFIRSHPVRHANESGWSEIVMHELTHYVSAFQDAAQKRELTRRFLDACPASIATGYYDLLEEPLAVAWGNAAYAKYVVGEPLDDAESWYWRPMPELLGQLLWPYVDAVYETDEDITGGIIDVAANKCRSLLELADMLEPIDKR